MNPRHFLRMAKWARHPPSAKRLRMVLIVVGVCIAIYAIERWIGWPDFLTAQGTGRRYRP